jgi:hypothetical protein
MIKLKLVTIAAGVALSTFICARAAEADTIDFTQWGLGVIGLASPLTGVTASGNTFLFTNGSSDPNAFTTETQSSTWAGTFPTGTNLLFSRAGPSSITLDFAKPLSTITLAAEPDTYGAYTETFQAFDGATLVGTVSAKQHQR